jgi:hypothetical protein
MDYMKFVNHHRLTQADITIACLPVDEERAKGFGLMKIDKDGLIKVGHACLSSSCLVLVMGHRHLMANTPR